MASLRDLKLEDFPIRTTFAVHWGDMDAFNHVNNIMFFRYFETSRMLYLTESGIMAEMSESNRGPILAETSCRFLSPVSFPDQLTVATRVSEAAAKSFTMQYALFSENQGRLVAVGEGLVIYFDYQANGKTDIPLHLRTNIAKMEGRGFSWD